MPELVIWKWFESVYGPEATLILFTAVLGYKTFVEYRSRPKGLSSPFEILTKRIDKFEKDLGSATAAVTEIDNRLHEAEKSIAVLNERTKK